MPEASNEPLVTLETTDSGVAIVTLRNPKVNALSHAVLTELRDHAVALRSDPPGAVIVTGGDRVFAAGADIAEFDGPDAAREAGTLFLEATAALEAIPRAVIAAVAGFALGGGLEIALACDFRMITDSARLGLPEVLLGILPGGGGTQRLPRLVGPSRAKDLILSGRQVRPDEALAMGLADRVVPADSLQTEALGWAESFARGAVLAQGFAKTAVNRGIEGTLDEGLAIEQDAFVDAFRTEDARIGIDSFLQHGPGKAEFTGR